MDKILLDTCIWLDYIWQKLAKNKKPAKDSKKLIDRLNGDDRFQIILSPFLLKAKTEIFFKYSLAFFTRVIILFKSCFVE